MIQFMHIFLLLSSGVFTLTDCQVPTLGDVLEVAGVGDTFYALVSLLANTSLYDSSYPFVLINDTLFPLQNQYLNYTPDALEFVIPFLLRYSGKITTEQSIAQSVVLAFVLARKFFRTLKAYPINSTRIADNYVFSKIANDYIPAEQLYVRKKRSSLYEILKGKYKNEKHLQ